MSSEPPVCSDITPNPALTTKILLLSSGFLPTEHPEANRVPLLARREVSCDPAEQEPVSVLPVQEMPRRRHVPRL